MSYVTQCIYCICGLISVISSIVIISGSSVITSASNSTSSIISTMLRACFVVMQ